MSKWKNNFDKENAEKQKQLESENHNDSNVFYTNVVPPFSNNESFHDQNRQNYQQNLTPEEIVAIKTQRMNTIPRNEQDWKYQNEKQQQFNQYNNYYYPPVAQKPIVTNNLLPAFNGAVIIPKPINFEIQMARFKQIFLLSISFLTMVIASIFIGFFFTHKFPAVTPSAIITIPLDIIALVIFLFNIIDFFTLSKEIKTYLTRAAQGSIIPPYFMVRNYRKIHGNKIIFNWIFSFVYIILGLAAAIVFLISGHKLTFLVQSLTVNVPILYKEGIAMLIVIGGCFFIHMMSLVLFHKRKSNINAYYGYEIVNPTDLQIYQKKINRICMIIVISFFSLIFFVIAIPVFILKRRRKKV